MLSRRIQDWVGLAGFTGQENGSFQNCHTRFPIGSWRMRCKSYGFIIKPCNGQRTLSDPKADLAKQATPVAFPSTPGFSTPVRLPRMIPSTPMSSSATRATATSSWITRNVWLISSLGYARLKKKATDLHLSSRIHEMASMSRFPIQPAPIPYSLSVLILASRSVEIRGSILLPHLFSPNETPQRFAGQTMKDRQLRWVLSDGGRESRVSRFSSTKTMTGGAVGRASTAETA